MSDKKLTIYIKTSPEKSTHFYKFNVNCYCGRCVIPKCAKCKNCSECNVIGNLRRRELNVVYNNPTSKNREAIIVAQSIKAVEKAYEAAFYAIRLCCCTPKEKTK